MNRRELFGAAGAAGAGLAVGGATLSAEDGHGGKAGGADKFMAPLGNHHLHFCGFHVAKADPRVQVVTQHYCGMRGDPGSEMHQCLLYDSAGKGAKLLGVEYIISDEMYRKLPAGENRSSSR